MCVCVCVQYIYSSIRPVACEILECFEIANKRVSKYAASESSVSNNSLPPSKLDIRWGKLFRRILL